MIERRKFLTGLVGLIAAPAIVRAASLMPVSVIKPTIAFVEHYGTRSWFTTYDTGYILTAQTVEEIGGGSLERGQKLLTDMMGSLNARARLSMVRPMAPQDRIAERYRRIS